MKSNKFIVGLFLFNAVASYINAEVLVFSKAYELALENANGIKAYIYTSKSDKEKIVQEESKLYPQINLSGYYKKSRYVTYPTDYDSSTTTDQGLFNYSLSVRQEVYNAQTYSKINTQELKSEYSESAVELKKEELAKDVFTAYLNILKSKNKIELLKSHLAHLKVQFQELTKKYELNLANKMDLLEIEVNYNFAQINLDKEKKIYDVFALKLKQFTGYAEYELPDIDADKSVGDIIDAMQEIVSKNRESLKIKQAKIALKMSKGEIELANDGHLPKVNMSASYAQYDTDDPTVDASYDNTSYVMLTLDIPIYSGGYTSSMVASTELLHKARLEDLVRIKKEVKIEHGKLLSIFESSVKSVTLYKDAIVSAELYVESIDQGFEHGLKSILDFHDAKVKLYEVKYRYIENMHEMITSYVGLLAVNNNFDNLELLDGLVQ